MASAETPLPGFASPGRAISGTRPSRMIVADAAEAAALRLAELGASVEEAHPEAGDPYPVLDVIWSCRMAGLFGPRLDEIEDQLDPGLAGVVRDAARYSGADYGRAILEQNTYVDVVRRFFDRYDLLLTPTLPGDGLPGGRRRTGKRRRVAPRRFLEWTAFTYPFNLTGQPAATLPCGEVDGLPVGLQMVGRWRTTPPCSAPRPPSRRSRPGVIAGRRVAGEA